MPPTLTPNPLVPVTTADGNLYIDQETTTRGSHGPFYAAFRHQDRTERYGWFCSACKSTDTVMDPMGTIVCNTCGNRRKPTRWDAAYL